MLDLAVDLAVDRQVGRSGVELFVWLGDAVWVHGGCDLVRRMCWFCCCFVDGSVDKLVAWVFGWGACLFVGGFLMFGDLLGWLVGLLFVRWTGLSWIANRLLCLAIALLPGVPLLCLNGWLAGGLVGWSAGWPDLW